VSRIERLLAIALFDRRAANPRVRDAIRLLVLCHKFSERPHSGSPRAISHIARRRREALEKLILPKLTPLLTEAFANLDSKQIEQLFQHARDIIERGPALPNQLKIFRTAEALGFRAVTLKELSAELKKRHNYAPEMNYLRRQCKEFGIPLRRDTVGRPKKTAVR
jgi:hypothetical protein